MPDSRDTEWPLALRSLPRLRAACQPGPAVLQTGPVPEVEPIAQAALVEEAWRLLALGNELSEAGDEVTAERSFARLLSWA